MLNLKTIVMNSKMLESIAKCINTCEECATDCINENGHSDCAMACRDCADICSLLYNFTSRKSQNTDLLKRLCVEICLKCANECEKHADHMPSCKACAEACRECAEACA